MSRTERHLVQLTWKEKDVLRLDQFNLSESRSNCLSPKGNCPFSQSGPMANRIHSCVQGTNADLIAAVARLYLRKGDRVADITFGL